VRLCFITLRSVIVTAVMSIIVAVVTVMAVAVVVIVVTVAVVVIMTVAVVVVRLREAGPRIEEQRIVSAAVAEVEHVLDRAGLGVDRTAAKTTTLEPVVFDEAHDGSLRDALMADVVLLREWRNDDEGHARAGTAAAVDRLAVQAMRLRAGAAPAGAIELVRGGIERGVVGVA